MSKLITPQSVVPPTLAEAAAAADIWARRGLLGRLVRVETQGEQRTTTQQATIKPVVEPA